MYSRVAPATVRWVISTKRPTPCCSCTRGSPGFSSRGTTWLRRLVGILRDERSALGWLVMSPAATRVSLRSGARKPWRSPDRMMDTTWGSGSSGSSSSTRAGVSWSRSISAMRLASPLPSTLDTTRQPRARSSVMVAMAFSASPRQPGSGSMSRIISGIPPANAASAAETDSPADADSPVGSSPCGALSGAAAKADRLHQPWPMSRLCWRTSASSWYDDAARSMGALPPAAAAAHEACRNSWLVRTRSAARVRTSSGSQTRVRVSGAITSTSSSTPSASAGMRASMPSTDWPCEIFSSISDSSGWASTRAAARCCTSGVMSSSRQGAATNSSTVSSVERWSPTVKKRRSSMVSPKKSTRTGWL